MAVTFKPVLRGCGWQTTPEFIPNAASDVVAVDVYVDEITLTNVSSDVVTVTITDKQSTPAAYLSAVSIAAHGVYVVTTKSRWFPGGINWVASAANAVIGYVSGHY